MLVPFSNTLLAVAEICGNRLLSLDHQMVDRCSELEGYCVEIHLTDLDLRVFCHPGSWGMRLSLEVPTKSIDASISGRTMALLSLAMQKDKISTSIQEGVSINGNASVAQKLQKIITELELDWEEALSHYTGDILAYRIHQQTRNAGDWLRQSAISITQTSSEYLREEIRVSPTQVEFDHLQQATTALKQDVERAEVRLRHLAQVVTGNSIK